MREIRATPSNQAALLLGEVAESRKRQKTSSNKEKTDKSKKQQLDLKLTGASFPPHIDGSDQLYHHGSDRSHGERQRVGVNFTAERPG
jgi:hypothetical protein